MKIIRNNYFQSYFFVNQITKSAKNYLLENGIGKEQIISINFEDMESDSLLDYKKLYKYLNDKIDYSKKTYIFLDEIQEVKNFQKVVDSLFIKPNVDI